MSTTQCRVVARAKIPALLFMENIFHKENLMKKNSSRFFGFAAALAALCAALILTACPGGGGVPPNTTTETLTLKGTTSNGETVQIILSTAADARAAYFTYYKVIRENIEVDSGTVTGTAITVYFKSSTGSGGSFTLTQKTTNGKTTWTLTGSIPGIDGGIRDNIFEEITTNSGDKPAELAPNATHEEAMAKIDELIAYCQANPGPNSRNTSQIEPLRDLRRNYSRPEDWQFISSRLIEVINIIRDNIV
jgi:hypothetical protein